MNIEAMSLDQINTQLQKNVTLLKLQAKQKAIASLREEQYKTQLEAQTKTAEEHMSALEKFSEGGIFGLFIETKYDEKTSAGAKNRQKLIDKTKEQIKTLDQLDEANNKEMQSLIMNGAQSRENIRDYSKMGVVTKDYTASVDKSSDAVDRKREALEKLKDLQERIAAAEKEYLTSLLSQEDQEKEAVKDKYEALIREADQYNQDSLLLREALDKGIADIDKKYREEERLKIEEETKKRQEERLKAAEEEQELLNKQYTDSLTARQEAELMMAIDQEKELLEQRFAFQKEIDKLNELQIAGAFKTQEEYNEALLNLEKKYQEKDKEIKDKYDAEEIKNKKDKIFQIAQMTSDALNLVASIAEENAGQDLKRQKQAFNFRKAANLAQATIDGTKAVLSTYADTPGGIVIKSIAATIAGGFAALKIAQIAKAKFESPSLGTDTGGGGGGGDAAALTANFNTVGTSGINQLATLQQQPVQAYVVSGEVTSAQALERNRVQNATL